jgi:DNA-binding FadR family transcriptional regulator
MLEAIRHIDLHSDIRSRLEDFIRDRGLGPGDQLPSEHELVRAMGVSRSALREALRSLEALGVVEARHGKGRFLNGFNFDTIGATLGYLLVLDASRAAELLEIRCALEVAFLPEAAARLTPEDIEELRGVVARMRARRLAGATTRSEEVAFHTALFRRVPNALLKELLVLFWELIGRLRASGALPPSRAHNIPDMHAEIVERVAARDFPAAVEVLSRHFSDLAERLRQISRPSD